MTAVAPLSFFSPEHKGHYFLVTFKPITDACWSFKKNSHHEYTISDLRGRSIPGPLLALIIRGEPILMKLGAIKGDRYVLKKNDHLIMVGEDHLVMVERQTFTFLEVEGLPDPLRIFGNGQIEVGCSTLPESSSRLVFEALARVYGVPLDSPRAKLPEPVAFDQPAHSSEPDTHRVILRKVAAAEEEEEGDVEDQKDWFEKEILSLENESPLGYG